MLLKLKNWFSIDNNVNLVRDLLFIFSLLFAMILGLSSCTPVAHAMETDDTYILNVGSYTVNDTVYDGASLEIPYQYTDKVVAFHNKGYLNVFAFDLVDASDDAYVSYVEGLASYFYIYGASSAKCMQFSVNGDNPVITYYDCVVEGNYLCSSRIYPMGNDFAILLANFDVINESDKSVFLESNVVLEKVEIVEVKEEPLCFTLPSYTIKENDYDSSVGDYVLKDVVYSGYPSIQIPYKYTDRIFAYHWYGVPVVIGIDLVDASDDVYISVRDSGQGCSFDIHGASVIEYAYYHYDSDTKEFVLNSIETNDNEGSPDGSININTFSYGFEPFAVVYSTSDIIDASDGSVYYRAFGSFASFMESLGSFGGFILSMWESVVDFVTDNPYILLSLLAWLLVMAAGGLLKMFKA